MLCSSTAQIRYYFAVIMIAFYSHRKDQHNDEIKKRIAECMEKAREEILLAVFYLTDRHLLSIMNDKAKNGCKVRIIYSNPDISENILTNHMGEPIYSFEYKQIVYVDALMHHKLLIVDRRNLIIGSYNYTERANYCNDESILYIINEEGECSHVLTEALITFEKLWGQDLGIQKKMKIKKINFFACISYGKSEPVIVGGSDEIVSVLKGLSVKISWEAENLFHISVQKNKESLYEGNLQKGYVLFTPDNTCDINITAIGFDGEIMKKHYPVIVNEISPADVLPPQIITEIMQKQIKRMEKHHKKITETLNRAISYILLNNF